MRKVFAGILLALSLPAMADLAADLKTMSPAEALKKAKTECGADCNDAELVKVMLQNNIPPQVVAQAAKASGIAPTTVAQSLAASGLPASVVTNIVVAANPDLSSTNPQFAQQINDAASAVRQQSPAAGSLGGGTTGTGSTTRRVTTPIVTTPTTTETVTVPVIPEPNAGQLQGSPT